MKQPIPIPAVDALGAEDRVRWRRIMADFLGTHGHSHFAPSSLSPLCVSTQMTMDFIYSWRAARLTPLDLR